MRRGHAAVAGLGLAFALAALGCGGTAATPEQEIRATLAAAEDDVRAHELAGLRARIATDYGDALGRDKAAIESILRVHFLRNSRIHLLVRVRDVTVDGEARARAQALVATAGRPIPGLAALAELDADLLWLDLDLARRDDAWLVTRAHWERARLEDLL